MGNCCISQPSLENPQSLRYAQQLTVTISPQNPLGKQLSTARVTVALTAPKLVHSDQHTIRNTVVRVSQCVLPGLDPRDEVVKECQDGVFSIQAENQLFVGLFDGHGKEGLKVVDCCTKFLKGHFLAHLEDFRSDSERAVERALHDCDDEVMRTVDCSTSGRCDAGSTAVILYLSGTAVMAASLGDSRAVLATLPDLAPPEESDPTPVEKPEPIPTKGAKYRRVLIPSRRLDAVPITTDQKPNHEAEMQRIQQCGGRVSRLTDEAGNRIGPYRVWRAHGNLPGLAMSRSLGDKIAKQIGVIATPIVQEFQYVPGVDQFFVVASDGVWYALCRDVMTNEEVVNFVERFRSICPQESKYSTDGVSPSTAAIAHLLCEEARYRWFGVVEEEDVMVDDISCVIVQLMAIEDPGNRPRVPRIAKMTNVSVSLDETTEDTSRPQGTDPLRNSVIPVEESSDGIRRNVVRRDLIRGSIVNTEESKIE